MISISASNAYQGLLQILRTHFVSCMEERNSTHKLPLQIRNNHKMDHFVPLRHNANVLMKEVASGEFLRVLSERITSSIVAALQNVS